MNTENSKTSEPHRFKLDLTGTFNLKNPKKNMALANLSIYYTWKNINSEYNNNKSKTSVPTWNETFDLSDGSYSIDDIQHYLEFTIKKNKTLTEKPPVQVYPNKIKNKIVSKVKTGYNLELLTPEKMRLMRIEVLLVHCNLVKNDYQYASKVVFSFAPGKQFGQLINLKQNYLIMMNTVNTEFSHIEVWFTDQSSKALDISI